MRNDAYRDISINNGPSRQIVHTILCARYNISGEKTSFEAM